MTEDYWACEPACPPEHWCTHCALEQQPPTHSISYSDVYLGETLIVRFGSCAEHNDVDLPAGMLLPIPDEDDD